MDSPALSSSSSSSSSSSFFSDDIEAGITESFASSYPMVGRSRTNYRTVGVVASPSARAGTPGFFYDALAEDEPRHFLDSCFLCKKPLGGNRDIFMYRGDKPFCSEECRQQQIEMDEAMEIEKSTGRSRGSYPLINTAASSVAQQKKNQFRAGTVVVS